MPSSKISERVSALYQAFEDVPKPPIIDGCPCCTDEAELTALLAKHRTDLTADDFDSYAFSVMKTVGSGADLQYFLPRILELAATDPRWWVDIEVIFGALSLADWRTWADTKCNAVLALAYAVLDDTSKMGEDGTEYFDSWICAVARAGVSPIAYLNDLFENGGAEQLRRFHEANASGIPKGRLANSYWPEEAAKSVVQWFNTPHIKKGIDDAYRDYYLNGD